MSLSKLLVVSLVVGAVAFIVPPFLFILGDGGHFTRLYPKSLYWSSDLLFVAWLAIFARAWYLERWRSAWLFLGLPLVAFWPLVIEYMMLGCLQGDCL